MFFQVILGGEALLSSGQNMQLLLTSGSLTEPCAYLGLVWCGIFLFNEVGSLEGEAPTLTKQEWGPTALF